MGDGWQPVHTCDDLDDFAATKCNIFDVDEKRTLVKASQASRVQEPNSAKNCPSEANV